MKTVTSFAIAIVTTALLGASTSVLAEGDASSALHVQTTQVAIADLDLTNQNDAQELLQRLQGAARDACKQSVWVQHRDRFHTERKLCQQAAYKNAVARIDDRFNINLEQVAGLSQQRPALAVSE